jgi:AraC family transcriptional regulator
MSTDRQTRNEQATGSCHSLGMETQLAEELVDATVDAGRSHQWKHQVITLLDVAVRQLREDQPAAQSTIRLATSLLQKQIDPHRAQQAPVESGRLLAWQARKVRDYIDAHITDRLPVAELGALLGQSEAHFSRTFKRTFGEPPHAFVIRRRLEFASDYMVQTEAPLSAIALQCGFSDQAHLCRAFRHATGLSPAVWRRTCKAGDGGNKLVGPASENPTERRRVA